MRAPQQDRSAGSADRMVEAALDLLGSGGLPAVTVAAVARAASTSNGALYHRFRDRTGLLLAAQDRALAELEAVVGDAFAAADAEPDDERAVHQLAAAAVDLFGTRRGALRAFMVEGRTVPELAPRTDAFAHGLATTITGWLRTRFGAAPAAAEAAYRIILALGVSQALLEEERISPVALAPQALADAIGTAVLALVRAPVHP
jgi:AcrR family transcriptional regulator